MQPGGHSADVSKMADDDGVGFLQFVIIVVVSVVFGGVLIIVVFFVGKKQDKTDISINEKVNDEKKSKEKPVKVDDNHVTTKSSKRSPNVAKDHPKQLCVLRGHTSDVLYIEFTTNGKILGSTSTGILLKSASLADALLLLLSLYRSFYFQIGR